MGDPIIGEIRKVIERLTWSARQQEVYLRGLGVAPSTDELALEFDDVWRMIEAAHERGSVSTHLKTLLDSIQNQFSEMSRSDNMKTWIVASLSNSFEWKRIREMAKEALKAIDAEGAK